MAHTVIVSRLTYRFCCFCYLWYYLLTLTKCMNIFIRFRPISQKINGSVYRHTGWIEFKSKTNRKSKRFFFPAWISPLFVMIKWRLSFVMTHTWVTWQTRHGSGKCNRQLTTKLVRRNIEILKFRFKWVEIHFKYEMHVHCQTGLWISP